MKVSIITACFNAEKTIATTLESVRRQVLPEGVEREHIVIDGGSADNTVQIVNEFESVRCPPSSSTSDLHLIRSAQTARYCTGRFFRWWMFRFATFPAHPGEIPAGLHARRANGRAFDGRVKKQCPNQPRRPARASGQRLWVVSAADLCEIPFQDLGIRFQGEINLAHDYEVSFFSLSHWVSHLPSGRFSRVIEWLRTTRG